MGLFGKLFDKKECAICGGEIGLLGNRKLEDGNMCKHCAAKLSPWFSDRKHSSVREIEAQLQYREENRARLNAFRVTRSFGEYCKMHVEEVDGVPTRFVVCRSNDYCEVNADIVEFKDVSSCTIDIREHRRELEYTNSKNERVKYDPPRYEYQYDFCVELVIQNNPYFDEIKFKLNNDSVDISTDQFGALPGGRSTQFDPRFHPQYSEYKKMTEEIEATVNAGRQGKPNVKFEDALLGVLNQLAGQNAAAPRQATPAQEAPRPKFCSNCGAPADGGKFCQHCGSKL